VQTYPSNNIQSLKSPIWIFFKVRWNGFNQRLLITDYGMMNISGVNFSIPIANRSAIV